MTPPPRAVVVHGIADARAALAAARDLGVAVTLASPPAAAESLGVGWWASLARRLRTEYPDVAFMALLDCGTRADLVQAALRQGLARDGTTALCFRGPTATARRLGDIAARYGAKIVGRMPQALDPADDSRRAAALAAWLSKTGPRRGAG